MTEEVMQKESTTWLMSLSKDFDERALALLKALQTPRVDERVVLLEDSKRNKSMSLRKDTPPLSELSAGDLKNFSLDALRKMARTEGLDLGKAPQRDRVLSELGELLKNQA